MEDSKFAVLTVGVNKSSEGLPVRKMNDVINQLTEEGYTVSIVNAK